METESSILESFETKRWYECIETGKRIYADEITEENGRIVFTEIMDARCNGVPVKKNIFYYKDEVLTSVRKLDL